MTPFMLDLAVLVIVGFCIWQGYRKGLILTVAGVLIILISAWAAGRIANQYSEPFAGKIQPVLGWLADDAIDEAARGKGNPNTLSDRAQLTEIAEQSLGGLGFAFVDKSGLVDKLFDYMEEKELSFRDALAFTFLRALSYMVLCVFGFIVVMILLTLLIHFIAAVFKLPVLNLIDKVGGTAAGLMYAVLILTVIGWALKYAGMLVPQELIERTVLLKMFFKSNLLSGVLGSIAK